MAIQIHTRLTAIPTGAVGLDVSAAVSARLALTGEQAENCDFGGVTSPKLADSFSIAKARAERAAKALSGNGRKYQIDAPPRSRAGVMPEETRDAARSLGFLHEDCDRARKVNVTVREGAERGANAATGIATYWRVQSASGRVVVLLSDGTPVPRVETHLGWDEDRFDQSCFTRLYNRVVAECGGRPISNGSRRNGRRMFIPAANAAKFLEWINRVVDETGGDVSYMATAVNPSPEAVTPILTGGSDSWESDMLARVKAIRGFDLTRTRGMNAAEKALAECRAELADFFNEVNGLLTTMETEHAAWSSAASEAVGEWETWANDAIANLAEYIGKGQDEDVLDLITPFDERDDGDDSDEAEEIHEAVAEGVAEDEDNWLGDFGENHEPVAEPVAEAEPVVEAEDDSFDDLVNSLW